VRQPNIYADTAILQNCGKILATGPHDTTGNYKNKTPLHLTKHPQSLITQILVNWQACKSAKNQTKHNLCAELVENSTQLLSTFPCYSKVWVIGVVKIDATACSTCFNFWL